MNTSRNQKEKVSKLLLLYASEEKEVDELPFGSIGVILGLKHTRTGDTLVSAGTSEKFQSTMRDILAIFLATLLPFSWAQSLKPVSPPQGFVSHHNGQFQLDGKPFVSFMWSYVLRASTSNG